MTAFAMLLAAATGTAAASPYGDAVLADGPIGYWNLDEQGGTTVANSGGAGAALAGELAGDHQLGVSGPFGDDGNTAASFVRSTDSGRIAWGEALEGVTATAGTWEAWLYFDDLNSQRIFGYTTTWAADGQWMLFVESTGRLAFALSDDGEPRTVTDISTQTWHHVAATWDGTELVLYLDGVAVDSTPAAAMLLDSSEAVGLSNSSDELGFNGAVDELAVYDYALSAEQVEAHFLAAQPDEGGGDTGPGGDGGGEDGGDGDEGGDDASGEERDDDADKGCTTAHGPLGGTLVMMAWLLVGVRRREDVGA